MRSNLDSDVALQSYSIIFTESSATIYETARRDDTFRVNNMRNYFPVMVVGYKGYHLLTIK